MILQRDPSSGRLLRKRGALLKPGPCCCEPGGESPPPPEGPGTGPDRGPTDPTGSTGCACFTQYTTMLVTVTGFVNCSPQRRLYNCVPGGPVDAYITITDLPTGTWAVPITYSPANSQVGYTNKDVILKTIPNAIEVRSSDGTLYSRGGIRIRLVSGKVRACNEKQIEAILVVETTRVIVQNKDAFNNQRGDFGNNCADPNGSPDTRTDNAALESFSLDCTVPCEFPLTCSQTKMPLTCPDPPNTVDGGLIAGGRATVTAV